MVSIVTLSAPPILCKPEREIKNCLTWAFAIAYVRWTEGTDPGQLNVSCLKSAFRPSRHFGHCHNAYRSSLLNVCKKSKFSLDIHELHQHQTTFGRPTRHGPLRKKSWSMDTNVWSQHLDSTCLDIYTTTTLTKGWSSNLKKAGF